MRCSQEKTKPDPTLLLWNQIFDDLSTMELVALMAYFTHCMTVKTPFSIFLPEGNAVHYTLHELTGSCFLAFLAAA